MTISGSNVTIGTISTGPKSTVTLSDSVITMSLSDLYQSEGSFGGVGSIVGNFQNAKGAMIMGMSDNSATTISVSKDFQNQGTIYFMINSRDLSTPGAFTTINSNMGVSLSGGKACICLSPYVNFQNGDKFDVVNAASILQGNFDTVDFACAECPTRSARSVESSSTCQPTTSTSIRSFSVLFESCGGGSGSNFLTSITPPYYVILPVAVGIILLLIIVFGGALLIDERLRKRRFKQKSKNKRNNRVSQMRKAASGSSKVSLSSVSSSSSSSAM